jgi:hypothetical protein
LTQFSKLEIITNILLGILVLLLFRSFNLRGSTCRIKSVEHRGCPKLIIATLNILIYLILAV